MKALYVIGRAMFGGFFLYNGINHFLHQEPLSQYASFKELPMPDEAVLASGALMTAAGISLVFGLKPRAGAPPEWSRSWLPPRLCSTISGTRRIHSSRKTT